MGSSMPLEDAQPCTTEVQRATFCLSGCVRATGHWAGNREWCGGDGMNTKRHDFDPERRHFLYAMASAPIGATIGSHALSSQGKNQPPLGEGAFELGDLQLESGTTLRNAKLAYKTHGQLNAAKSNVIL